MTSVKPDARPLLGSLLLGSLLLAALATYAAMSLSHILSPSGASITFTEKTQLESPANAGDGLSRTAPTDAGQPYVGGAPLDSVGRSVGTGIQRFADAPPEIGGQSVLQAVPSCPPKGCPRPQR